MVSKHSVICRFAFFIFLFLTFITYNVNGIDELDVLLCGSKGNQYYITSTPFITRGAYLYADLLIKVIKAPWPVRPNGVPYTRDELKLTLVKNVILTSPLRLRYMISQLNPPKDNAWSFWMEKFVSYPEALSIVNDLRFSTFLCGPDMLNSKIVQKFIRRMNRKYAYNFNPFRDKVVIAALKLHGVKDDEIKRKSEFIGAQFEPIKPLEEKANIGTKLIMDSKLLSPTITLPTSSYVNSSQISVKNAKENIYNNKPVILSDSEFDEFRDEKSVDSDFDKTPSLTNEASMFSSHELEKIQPNIQIPQMNLIYDGIEKEQIKSDVDDIRVSNINKNLLENDISDTNILNNKFNSLPGDYYEASDQTELPELEGLNIDRTRGALFGGNTQKYKESSNSPILDINSSNILEPINKHSDIYLFNNKSRVSDEIRMIKNNISYEKLSKGFMEEPDDLLSTSKNYVNPLDLVRTDSKNGTNNYGNSNTFYSGLFQEEIQDYEDEDAYDDEEDIDNMTDEEYYKYLDYKYYTQTNKNEMSKYGSNLSHGKSLPPQQNYPLGTNESAPKAYLQDVSSVFGDLFNAVKEGKLSPKNILYGIPEVDLKLNSRSKPISFKDRVVKKWRAQEVDGVFKSIPIFRMSDFESFNNATKDLNVNKKKDLFLLEVDFDSALSSHDKNEGGYNWIQKNLYLTKTTSGFQDVLIKAAIKSLEIITSIQCSSILEKPISSKEVNDCIIAYFGSIKYGQNKVYGTITKNEDDTIHGYEVVQNIKNKNLERDRMSSHNLFDFDRSNQEKILKENIISRETNGADEVIKKHLLNNFNLDTIVSASKEISAAKGNYMGNANNIVIGEISDDDESNSYDESDFDTGHLGGMLFDESKTNTSSMGNIDNNEPDKIIKNFLTKGNNGIDSYSSKRSDKFLDLNRDFSLEDSLSSNSGHETSGFKGQLRQKDSIGSSGLPTSSKIDKMPHKTVNENTHPNEYNLMSYKINDGYFDKNVDPEFIDSELEQLAYNVTEVYKKVVEATKIVSKDATTIISLYGDFIEKVRLWGAIAGEALKYSGRKLSSIIAGEKQRLSYLYNREEFYMYYAILYYSFNIIQIFKTFIALRETLNKVKELLKKSFDSNINYESIVELSDSYMKLENKFNSSYYGSVDVFCGTMTLVECLGIMKDDFYRRNEKYCNFIARNSELRRVLSQIFELFGINIYKMGEAVMGEGISRDDVSRYLVVKEYIGFQSHFLTKKITVGTLKSQILSNERDSNFIINSFLGKHNLESKNGRCGRVMWVGPNSKKGNCSEDDTVFEECDDEINPED
ncbi:hypothetical protein FG386_003484 [Cryptosporidium ryanae]|uniref:uncharacterized protein n=1 Tax=Cryptosporidium ryanae TaxID=515981 RepID=UPI00351A5CA7|nr:hypothetical protein FG386_003484 [Cryptosporidium ryanae]